MAGVDDAPFGSRLVSFLYDSARPILFSTVLFTTLGLALGALLPRPYLDTAVVEIGVRFQKEPLESPIVSARRLKGLCQEEAIQLDPSAEIEIHHRRDEKNNHLTRMMDVRVGARTASTSRAILDRGLARLLEEHRQAWNYEIEVEGEQLDLLKDAVSRLEDRATAFGGQDAVINARLYETRRLVEATSAMLAPARTPPTRVVTRASQPLAEPSRISILMVGGLIFGLLVGMTWSSVRAELSAARAAAVRRNRVRAA